MPVKKREFDPEVLRDLYTNKRLQIQKIAEALNSSYRTISKALAEAGLTKHKPHRDAGIVPEVAKRMYLEEGKTMLEIAKHFGCSQPGIRRHIASRGYLKPQRSVRKGNVRFTLSKDDLYDLYITKQMSDMAIGKKLNVNNVTVANWRKRYGIKRDNPVNLLPLPVEDLRRMYIEEKQSMESIATYFGCGESTVRAHIIKNGLNIDSSEVAKRKIENNKKSSTYSYVVSGYRMIKMPDHPSANSEGYVHEHRYVAGCAAKRHLESSQSVHHIGIMDKLDNRVENLAILTKRQHSLVHRYMEKAFAFSKGLTFIRPRPLVFDEPVFWAGEWISQLDMLDGYEGTGKDKHIDDLNKIIAKKDRAIIARNLALATLINRSLDMLSLAKKVSSSQGVIEDIQQCIDDARKALDSSNGNAIFRDSNGNWLEDIDPVYIAKEQPLKTQELDPVEEECGDDQDDEDDSLCDCDFEGCRGGYICCSGVEECNRPLTEEEMARPLEISQEKLSSLLTQTPLPV